MSKPILVLVMTAAAAAWGCDQNDPLPMDSATDNYSDSPADTGGDTGFDSPADTAPDTTPDAVDDAEDAVTARVQFETSMGSFVVGLYGNAGPITVENFMTYVDEGFYSDLIFHRVIADFMIQGGGFYSDMTPASPHGPITLEIIPWLSHQPGVISMARTSVPDSATSQFFICVSDDSGLDGDYAAFGEVESGYDVVQSISEVATHTVGSYEDVPVTPVVITSVTRL
jgi:peptidyl-prolyl cis-trans isomerase A (cyclophilin A)